jgi:hypothetical protein
VIASPRGKGRLEWNSIEKKGKEQNRRDRNSKPAWVRHESQARVKSFPFNRADVRKEMVEEKGLSEQVADQIGEDVGHSGTIREILEALKLDPKFSENGNVTAGPEDITLLASSYLEALGFDDESRLIVPLLEASITTLD